MAWAVALSVNDGEAAEFSVDTHRRVLASQGTMTSKWRIGA